MRWKKRRLSLMLGLVLILDLTCLVLAQDPARERLGREASNQAREADRLFHAGDFAAALPLYQAEQKSRSALGDVRYEAYAFRGIACCLGRLNDLPGAIKALQAAKRLDLTLDDTGLAGYDALLASRAFGQLDQHEKAVSEARFALARFTKGEDRDHEAETRVELGKAFTSLGKLKEAAEELRKASAIAQELKLPTLSAETWAALGRLERVEGRLPEALKHFTDARNLFLSELKSPIQVARIDEELGDLYAVMGKFEEAEKSFESTRDTFAKLGNPVGSAMAAMSLAAIRLDRKNARGALEAATYALDRLQTAGLRTQEIETLVIQANATNLLGKREDAYQIVEKAIKLSDRAHQEHPEERIRLRLLAAQLARGLGRTEMAEAHKKVAKSLVELVDDEELRESLAAQLK